MRKSMASFALMVVSLITEVNAVVIIDFSPDMTGATLSQDSYTNLYGAQILGDEFTLLSEETLTGGSIFSNSGFGSLSTPVRFMIFSDPTAAAIIDFQTTLDAVDTQGTLTQASMTRKHATITPTSLAAGNYWFALVGDGLDIGQGTGNYGDNSFRYGSTTLVNSGASGGDAFFQLEAVPEPGTIGLLSLGSLALLIHRRRGAGISAAKL